MSFQEIANAISKDAPLLASVIGSANPIAGVLVGLVGSTLGATSNSAENVLQKLVETPDAMLKIKQLEYQHAESLKQMSVDDTKSAREMAASDSGRMRWVRPFLVIMVFLLIIANILLIVLMPHGSGEFVHIAYTTFGALLVMAQQCFRFYLGE